ncbi:MAG: hypothetical protein JNL61_07800 [Rhizobiaceae bacterium]|nr:hypothetical protein [Rhizobiaceae bacterium]
MGILSRSQGAAAVFGLSMLAAACVSSPPSQGPSANAPVGVEGEWISTDGVAISRFNGGAFETVATDTGSKLADGTYRMIDPKTVEITVVSRIRQTTSAVNCALIGSAQLNCTSSAGQQFVLTRRPIGPA